MHYDLNSGWRFSPHFSQEMLQPEYDDGGLEEVRLPHSCKQLPLHYFNEKDCQFTSCYRKTISVPQSWQGQAVLLHFEGVAHYAELYINGQLALTHSCGYTGFSADIAPLLTGRETAVIALMADSRESLNQPPFGGVIDYLCYGGIYRQVSIEVKNPLHIADVFVTTPAPLAADKTVQAAVQFSGDTSGLMLGAAVQDAQGNTLHTEVFALAGREHTLAMQAPGAALWNVESPVLYHLRLELLQGNQPLDETSVRFGFRQAEFKKDGFYLNGSLLKIRGLNRHQSWPYAGYAMPERPQKLDADMLKQELGVNAVRTSHYPQSKHFINRCDELGLLVFTEVPGWQHIGDASWKAQSVQNTKDMVLQYRNHPSIIIWGVRINESEDDDAFYTQANAAARQLDPTRPTGGVRFLRKSHLLEDVYTYNDFLHNGHTPGLAEKKEVTPDRNAPYLVTEYNGHMYPTKAYDDEPHRLEHALRHARVVSDMYYRKEIAGCFGWCMFDYHTHKDFGSGDGICYHGVMDMFRNHKMAAAVYASQQAARPVLHVGSAMDIGDYPGGSIGRVVAFTNADSVKLYRNKEFIKEFTPDKAGYPGLPHPPVVMEDFIGNQLAEKEGLPPQIAEKIKEVLRAAARYGHNSLPLKYKLKMLGLMLFHRLSFAEGVRLFKTYMGDWGGGRPVYRFEAVSHGQPVLAVEKAAVTAPCLHAEADTALLDEGATYDVATIRIRAVSPEGETLPYWQEPVMLQAQGPIELIGPGVISLKGGMGGTYVRTLGKAGSANLTISSGQLGSCTLAFTVRLNAGNSL